MEFLQKSLYGMPLKLLAKIFWDIVRLSLLTVRNGIMHVNSTYLTSIKRSNFIFLETACMDVSYCYIYNYMEFVTSTLILISNIAFFWNDRIFILFIWNLLMSCFQVSLTREVFSTAGKNGCTENCAWKYGVWSSKLIYFIKKNVFLIKRKHQWRSQC